MTFGVLRDHVGYTSDHTYVECMVESYSKDGDSIVLRGLTFNMMNQGHAKSEQFKFSNNPFNLDEINVSYIKRKIEQLKFLFSKIKANSLDFIALQEVDIFTGKSLPDFVSDFLIKMNSKSWGSVHSVPADNLNMPLLILYNKKNLEIISQKAIFPRDDDGKNCALEAMFRDKKTGATVCVVNMHLDYNTDHSAAIFEYQKHQIIDGKFTVIAGDVNHKDLYFTLAGDKLISTNIANPDTDPSLKDGELLQTIDGFMANPAHSDTFVRISITGGGYFKWKPSNKIKTFLRPNPATEDKGKFSFVVLSKDDLKHCVYQSLVGSPYIVPAKSFKILMPDGSSSPHLSPFAKKN